MLKPLLCWLLAVNLVTFCVYGVDKRKARKHRFRVRESVLLGLCAVGGSVGGLLAMHLFHHKTRKKAFAIGVPLMLAVQTALLVWLIRMTYI